MTSASSRSLGTLFVGVVCLVCGAESAPHAQRGEAERGPGLDQPARSPGGRTVSRRLNRAEYANAVRDLLGVEVDPAALLPADGTVEGFDTTAAALSVSPLLLGRYLAAAGSISRQAIGGRVVAAGDASHTYEASQTVFQDGRMGDDLPFGSRGGLAARHHFPVDGEYVVRVRLRRNVLGYVRALHDAHRLEIRLDGRRVAERTMGGETAGTPAPLGFTGVFLGDPAWEARTLTADHDLKFPLRIGAGGHLVSASFVDEPYEVEGVLQPPLTGLGLGFSEFSSAPTGPWGPAVDAVSIEGPLVQTGGLAAQRSQPALACGAGLPEDEETCARRLLTGLATRGYRGLATQADIDRLSARYRAARTASGDFGTGMQEAIERLLVDPKFLFRIERDPLDAVPGAAYPVSDLDLASRLSFFIWSSIPDEPLLTLASRGGLSATATLDTEVTRLLADRRALALVDRFAMQWLGLGALRPVTLDSEILTEYDGNLREAFLRETQLFLADHFRSDRSILELLTARHTFLNDRLARHYGIAGVYGSHFRRVTVSADRAGLLGHGSILTTTSYPTRTSPVLRGRWLLDTMLGAPPPPPPPDIPSLPLRGANNEPQTVRQRTELHRRNPACASCHVRMDPLGFSLERFDAIGRLRAVDEHGARVDATATLPDGATFEGVEGLRAYLVDRPEPFVRAFTAKLMTYAIGRTLGDAEAAAVTAIVSSAAKDDYRWSAIVRGVVRSAPFRMRQAS